MTNNAMELQKLREELNTLTEKESLNSKKVLELSRIIDTKILKYYCENRVDLSGSLHKFSASYL